MLVGRTESKLHEVAREIEERGGDAGVVRCDVAMPDQIDAAVEATVERFATIDVLVNAAHHNTRSGRLLDVADEEIELQWATGPRATLRFMRRCHPYLTGGGAVVNFGSGAQLTPQRFGIYAAMKDAIRSISRAAAVEWGPDGIRVNVVAPLVSSPTMDEEVPEERRAALLRGVPLGRIGDAEHDVGSAVVFLSSDAAAFVTGQLLLVDGGQTYLR
jgi:NAD(P)-dependent dehydrogenase (short-subunit alcohol dehydrogenase family)